MLKKTLGLLLALMLLMAAAAAQADEAAVEIDNDPLQWEELRLWCDECLERAASTQPMTPPVLTEDGYQFLYDFATLYLSTASITGETVVKAVEITSGSTEAPHMTRVGMTTGEVLDSYYMDNPDLYGTRDAAVIYLCGTERGIRYGWVQRELQQVMLIEYAVCEQAENGGEGYVDAGVTYVLTDGYVSAIRVYGLDARVDEDGLRLRDTLMETLQGADEYTTVRSSFDGTVLTPFGPEDLQFAGIDFETMDSVQTVSALGEVKHESWVVNDDGGYIHTLAFAGCEVTALCDSNKSNPKTQMVTIFSDAMEGPRRTRIGDSMISVRNRFRHEDGQFIDGTATEILYGTPDEIPYAVADYSPTGVHTLRYICQMTTGQPALLLFTFEDYELTEIVICVME